MLSNLLYQLENSLENYRKLHFDGRKDYIRIDIHMDDQQWALNLLGYSISLF